MDVSGSMTDEQKEIVRIEAFWIDTWLKAHYKGVETRLHHPRRRRPGGGRAHLLPHPRESAAPRSARPTSWPTRSSTTRYPPDRVEHLRLPLLRRRQLGRRHPALHRDPARRSCCRKVNLFGYGQVESPYGSGEFYEYIHEMLGERDNVVVQPHPRPRRDPRLDQGVPRHRPVTMHRFAER